MQRFKGPVCRLAAFRRKLKNALSKSGQVFTPSLLCRSRKVCGPGCSAGLLVKPMQSPLESYTHLFSLRGHCLTALVFGTHGWLCNYYRSQTRFALNGITLFFCFLKGAVTFDFANKLILCRHLRKALL